MNKFETLVQMIDQSKITIILYPFKSPRIKAMCSNDIIALSTKLKTDKEKLCVLVEEYFHILINEGNITQNEKEENKARILSYKVLMSEDSLIDAYKRGYKTIHKISNYLGITEEFLKDGIKYYRKKYGSNLRINEHVIYFQPSLKIKEKPLC